MAAGPIVQSLNWHWLFWFPAVLIVIALLGAIFGVPESAVRKPGRLDIVGTFILAVALSSILLAVSDGQKWGWGSALTLGLLALGVVALVGFVLVELRVRQPLVDVRLFRIRGVWTAHVVALVVGFGMFGLFILIPPLLELPTSTGFGFGATVTEAGLLLLPLVLAMVVFGPLGGRLVRKRGAKLPMRRPSRHRRSAGAVLVSGSGGGRLDRLPAAWSAQAAQCGSAGSSGVDSSGEDSSAR